MSLPTFPGDLFFLVKLFYFYKNAPKLKAHVLGPFHFIWWIEAKYKPSTHQEFRYLKFDLTNWVPENGNFSKTISAKGQPRWQNDRNAILYDISFSGKVERVLFHPLSSHFLKENLFWGVPVLAFLLAFLVPKVHWGLKNMWKKFRKFAKKIDDLRRNFVQRFSFILFQICFLWPKRF